MKILKSLAYILFYIGYINPSFAVLDEWNDMDQDIIQINNPIQYIDIYNRYMLINPNFKIKLKDLGNISKNKNNISYVQKKLVFKF